MLRERARLIEALLFFADVMAATASLFLAWWIRNSMEGPDLAPILPVSHYLYLLPAIVPVWGILFRFTNLYRSYRTSTIYRECAAILRVVIASGIMLGFIIFLFKDYLIISRLFFVFFLVINAVLMIFMRVLIRTMARFLRKKGFNSRYMIIVGDDRRAYEFAQMVQSTGDWGYRILGFVTLERGKADPGIARSYRLLGSIDDLRDIVLNEVVDEVVFLVTRKKLDDLEDLFLFLEDVGVNARVALNFFPNVIARTYISSLKGIPLLSFSTIPRDSVSLFVKTVMDKVVSTCLLVLLSPIFLTVALLIRLTSRGPVIIRQIRCGLNGRRFVMYKFRSMVADAEEKKKNLCTLNEMDGPVFKMRKDPRVTHVGRWLRRTSVDEFPQLLNVLKGDMSLVGPRPALPEEVEKYERWQRRRLSMKPGLTCLWQVNGRNKIDFERWMRMDLDYIDNWRLELDFKILLKTIPVILSLNGM